MATEDPLANDPANWGHSLANVAEIILGCLDAAGAKSVAEVGAYEGDLTRVLLDWAAGAGARVVAIDPAPHARLIEASSNRAELELIESTSVEALRDLSLPDAVIIDGDHNYYTVSEELRLIGDRAPGRELPLLVFHDVGWPLGRRDGYQSPGRIPEEHRHPSIKRPFLRPGEPGVVDDGLPMYAAAAHEGGPRNGVLTALEDFLDHRADVELAIVPVFFGLGVIWHRDVSWAGAVAALLEPWDRNAVLERLEANRLHQLTEKHAHGLNLLRTQAKLKAARKENEELRRLAAEQRSELERLRARTPPEAS